MLTKTGTGVESPPTLLADARFAARSPGSAAFFGRNGRSSTFPKSVAMLSDEFVSQLHQLLRPLRGHAQTASHFLSRGRDICE